MHVLFHIGAAKTASTSIQYFLHQYRHSLSDSGYFYPFNTKFKHSEFALAASFDMYDSADLYRRYAPDLPDNDFDFLFHFKHVISSYLCDFKESGCHTLLLSDEILPYRCNTLESLIVLRSFFPTSCSFQFVYYKRSPADMYLSLYSTLIKVGQTNISPFAFRLPHPASNQCEWIASPEMFDHNNIINNISIVFGSDSINVYDFDLIKHSPLCASIVHHFLDVCFISIPYKPSQSLNPRLDYISLYILHQYNILSDLVSPFKPFSFVFRYFRINILIPFVELISLYSPFKFPGKNIIRHQHYFNSFFTNESTLP